MLFYVRNDMRSEILEHPSKSEVSENLRDQFVQEMDKFDKIYDRIDWYSGCDLIYMICEEMIIGWESFGVMPSLENIHEQPPLLDNPRYRKLINVAKKISVFEFIRQMKCMAKNDFIQTILIYKIEFPSNNSSNKNTELVFKPIDVFSRELLFNNTKKNPKKSIFYVKVIEKDKSLETCSVKIVSNICLNKFHELEETEKQLSDFANNQGINVFKPLEIQYYLFDPNSEEDDLNFVKLLDCDFEVNLVEAVETSGEEESKDDSKDDSKEENYSGSKQNKNDTEQKNEIERDEEIVSAENEVKQFYENYSLVFLKFYDLLSNKMYVVGDTLLNKKLSLCELQNSILHRHIRWSETSQNQNKNSKFLIDISLDKSRDISDGNCCCINCDQTQNKNNSFDQTNSYDKDNLIDSFTDDLIIFEETSSI